MEYLRRNIDNYLLQWKTENGRKPLLLRGARQVGKSSVVRHFAKQFDFFLELNFEQHIAARSIFENNLTPEIICEELAVMFNTPIEPGRTLLFFDEIQACPRAIASLRFFYEQYPDLHLIAAGSLLEFALADLPSFGVGRIRSIFLFPFSFDEFMRAMGENMLLAAIRKASPNKPLSESVHQKALHLYRRFLVLGGMPNVISTYKTTGSLLACQQILDDLIQAYNDDFRKYNKRISIFILHEVFRSVVQQTGNKYVYAKASPELNRLQVKASLRLLEMAGLIYPVTHTAATGLPLGAKLNEKIRKFIVFDTGIFQRIQGVDISELLLTDDIQAINKGAVAELAVGIELKKSAGFLQNSDLYYWVREKKNSQAEVDYVLQKGSEIIPIEVKSGTKGSMQSLFVFLHEKQIEKGIRISQENFTSYEKIDIFPLYAVKNIFQ